MTHDPEGLPDFTTRDALADTLVQLVDEAEPCDCDHLDAACVYCWARVQVWHLRVEGVL